MIGQLRGKITHLDEKFVIIDVAGVGYKVFTTPQTKSGLPKDRELTLRTHLVVREDALDLYGFSTKNELDFFQLLLTVSGVGPKSALAVLTLANPDTLSQAVNAGNSDYLIKVSGLGRKLAEKIVLELRDKISVSDGGAPVAGLRRDTDAMLALQAMGYTERDIREVLKKLPAEITDTSAKVKFALKNIGN